VDVRFLGEIDTVEVATRQLVVKLATEYPQLTSCCCRAAGMNPKPICADRRLSRLCRDASSTARSISVMQWGATNLSAIRLVPTRRPMGTMPPTPRIDTVYTASDGRRAAFPV
jgi:hypothetical protein